MARRDFRQLGLADSIVRRRGKKGEWLDRLDAALDWPALERIVAGVYASREGGLAYPLLTYVKLLLLQQWYGLSDEGLEAAVDDRLSFRRFAGIPLAEGVPDHSSSVTARPWPHGTCAGIGPKLCAFHADPGFNSADSVSLARMVRCGSTVATQVRKSMPKRS